VNGLINTDIIADTAMSGPFADIQRVNGYSLYPEGEHPSQPWLVSIRLAIDEASILLTQSPAF